MTECATGPVKGVLKRSIAYQGLDDVRLKRLFIPPKRMIFLANSLETFESLPGAKGYEYVVNPLTSRAELKIFVTDVRLAIAQATMEHFTQQIEETLGD